MPKFKDKVIRKADGGELPLGSPSKFKNESPLVPLKTYMGYEDAFKKPAYYRNLEVGNDYPYLNKFAKNPPVKSASSIGAGPSSNNVSALNKPTTGNAPKPSVKKMMDIINEKNSKNPTGGLDYLGDSSFLTQKPSDLDNPPELKSVAPNMPNVATPDMSKMAGSIPKTKSGMKKFMDEYGKFIALGALAGAGGKKGMIAAPIMAALPGILKMLQNRGKKNTGAPAAASSFPALPTSGGDNPPAASSFPDLPTGGGDYPGAPVDTLNVAHGGLLGNKYAAHPKKKMAGGTVRKFSGGVMKKVTKKFAEGGEGKSDKRESAFRRLKPQYRTDLSFLGTTTPLRKDSISERLMKEEDTKYYPFGDSDAQKDDKDMKRALASIVDEMYNSKNRLPTGGGFNDDNYQSPMVSERYNKKNMGTKGVPYDSELFKAEQARHINPSVKVSGDKTPKKMVGGSIRKFSGGSMNTMKDNLMPKYKKGGDMPKGMPKEMMAMMGKKGKATGDMPEHKKMDMGMPIGKMPDSKKMGMAKPKPSSMDQKFAKGGTAKYASGGMCKGYGMAKKIRPTGSMN